MRNVCFHLNIYQLCGVVEGDHVYLGVVCD
jgi:hypothetical protein